MKKELILIFNVSKMNVEGEFSSLEVSVDNTVRNEYELKYLEDGIYLAEDEVEEERKSELLSEEDVLVTVVIFAAIILVLTSIVIIATVAIFQTGYCGETNRFTF